MRWMSLLWVSLFSVAWVLSGCSQTSPRLLEVPDGEPLIIQDVQVVRYMRPQIGWNGSAKNNGKPIEHVACLITAKNGSFGLADRGAKPFPEDIGKWVEALETGLAGKDAREVMEIHDTLPTDAGAKGIILVDRALWDLVARDADKPLHAVFGTKRKKIPAYFSKGALAKFKGNQDRTKVMAWKIHAWPNAWRKGTPENATIETHEPIIAPPERCVAFFEGAHQALGKKVTIMADVHYHFWPKDETPWTYDEVIEVAKGLEKLDVYWLEGLGHVLDNPELYKRLKAEVPGMRLQQEYIDFDKFDTIWEAMTEYPELIDQQSADPNIMSFTQQVYIANWAIAHGKLFDSHWPDVSSLQLAAAMTDKQYPFFEISAEYHNSILTQNGVVKAPVLPGLMPIFLPEKDSEGNWKIVDWEYILEHRVR